MRLVKFISTTSKLRGSININRLNVDKLIINGRANHGYAMCDDDEFEIVKYCDQAMIYRHECHDAYYCMYESHLYNKLCIYRWSQQNPWTIIKDFQLHYTNTNHISFVRNNNASITICDTIVIYIKFVHRGYDRIKFYCSYVDGCATIHRAQIPSYGRPELVINM